MKHFRAVRRFGLALGEPGVTPSGLLTISKSGAGVGSVTSSPAGIACGGRCVFLFSTGSITLTASPAPGSVFTGWSGGGCSGTAPCTLDLSADTGVSATFSLVVPPGLGLVPSGTSFQVGDFVSFTLTFSNPGPAGGGDFYFGVLVPAALGPSLGCPAGDAIVLFAAGFTPAPSCISSAPSTFAPFALNLTVPAGVSPVTFPGFFGFALPPGTPPGTYVFFVVLTALGAFNGQAVSLADVAGLGTAVIIVVP